MQSDIVDRLIEASTHALMSASRATVLEAAEEIKRLRATRCHKVTVHDTQAWGFVGSSDDAQKVEQKLGGAVGVALIDGEAVPLCRVPSLAAEEREAIEGMAAYLDTRGNLTLQAWGSLLRVLLRRWK